MFGVLLGKPIALPFSWPVAMCIVQRWLALCQQNCPQFFRVAVRAPQVKDPRTFLRVCVRDTEREGAVPRPPLPPFLKSDFCLLLCIMHRNLEGKIRFDLFHPFPPTPSPPVWPSALFGLRHIINFQPDVSRVTSVLLGTQKGYSS